MSDIHGDLVAKLFAKYRHSPNILGVLEILATAIQDTCDAADYLVDHLSIDAGEGDVLKALGGWIGVDPPPLQETDLFMLVADEDLADDPENHHGLAPEDLSSGGFLVREDGLPSLDDLDSYFSDETFREFIRAKAATFGKIATRENLYLYLLQFGLRCKIEEGVRVQEIEPSSYEDLSQFLRYQILEKGFRTGGVSLTVKPQPSTSGEI